MKPFFKFPEVHEEVRTVEYTLPEIPEVITKQFVRQAIFDYARKHILYQPATDPDKYRITNELAQFLSELLGTTVYPGHLPIYFGKDYDEYPSVDFDIDEFCLKHHILI